MSIQTTLSGLGVPVVYGRFSTKQTPPFIVYIGDGQDVFDADDTHYHTANSYQIQYYFKKKNEQNERAIEAALLQDGFLYEKSPDAYIESEDIWVIYYYV